MKKTYKIDVDCANCANKMELAAQKTPGVKNATVKRGGKPPVFNFFHRLFHGFSGKLQKARGKVLFVPDHLGKTGGICGERLAPV